MFLLIFVTVPARAQVSIDEPPRLESEVMAEYPESALTAGVEATVLFELDIDASGRVTRAVIQESSATPEHGFEAAAQRAIEQFRFVPARAQGTAVPVRIGYRYRFVLPAPGAPVAEAAADPVAEPEPEARAAPEAQGELSGSVLERGTRSPLVGARVLIQRNTEAYETFSDEHGSFSFYDLAPGTWQLSIGSPGFIDSRGPEDVVAHERTDVKLYLERSPDNPYDVIVEAQAPRREVTRHRLSMQEAQSQPGTLGDPLLAVGNLPGVATLPFDPAGLSMRGAAPDESMVYLDGLRMPIFYHFIGLRSIIAPGMLESLELYPGGAPVQYGRQLGGVLGVRLKTLNPDRIHGYVDVSMLDAGAYVETPITDRISIAVAARASYIDRVMQALDAPLPRYDDYQLLLNARPSKAHRLQLLYMGSDDAFELDTDDLREESAQVTFGTLEAEAHMQHVALAHDYTPSNVVSNHARIGYLHFRSDTTLGSDARINFDYNVLQLRDLLRVTPSDFIDLELGIDAEVGRWGTDVLVAPPPHDGEPQGYVNFAEERRAHREGVDAHAAGGFVSAVIKPVESLTLVPGVRADLQPQIHTLTFDPRISARYALLDQLAFKAGTGVHHQSPSLDQAAKRFGNPNLGAERSLQHSAGVEVMPLSFLTLELTGFLHQLDGLAARSDRVKREGDTLVPLEYENTGEGRAYGLEVMLRQQLAHRLSGWIAYTYSKSERRRTANEPYRLFDYDQTHNLVLVAAYQLPFHMQLSTRFRYRTGQPTTPVVGATFVSDTDEYAPTFGATNSSRLDAFHQLDLRLDKRWVFDRCSLGAYLDVQNVTNRKNPVAVSYNYDYSESAKASGVPLLTIVGVRADY
jgi:TonB family protein